ncbi:hypothetical protein [Mesorhizobium sp. M0276]|uniref:hypothetical protein n=1 Tax=Mesorhizobium sp. M0276 TaxID=2956928 RepID=UPI003337769E
MNIMFMLLKTSSPSAVPSMPHQTERLQPGDERADLLGQRAVEPGIGWPNGSFAQWHRGLRKQDGRPVIRRHPL